MPGRWEEAEEGRERAQKVRVAHLLSIPSRMHARVSPPTRLRASHTSSVYARKRPTGVLINSITLLDGARTASAPRPRSEVLSVAHKKMWERQRINSDIKIWHKVCRREGLIKDYEVLITMIPFWKKDRIVSPLKKIIWWRKEKDSALIICKIESRWNELVFTYDIAYNVVNKRWHIDIRLNNND